MKLLYLFAISLSINVLGENRPHTEGPATTTARPQASSRACVCQYQVEPQNCGRHQTASACEEQTDCFWFAHYRQRTLLSRVVGTRIGGWTGVACRNWFKEYCDTEFEDRPPSGGCSTTTVIPSTATIPACLVQGGDYYFTYSGHGPRTEDFQESIRDVTQRSARGCNLAFNDQSCETFRTYEISSVKEFIEQTVRPLMTGAQRISVQANQIESHGGNDFSRRPYEAYNPYYRFSFTRTELRESVVPCDTPHDCTTSMHRQSYWCQAATGRVPWSCCCGSGFTANGTCAWRENSLTCSTP